MGSVRIQTGIRPGDVVVSRCGRDAGRQMLVLAGTNSEGCVVLADGRVRRVEKPKRKKAKHVTLMNGLERGDTAYSAVPEAALASLSKAAEKLRVGETVSNSEVRRALSAYAEVYGSEVRRDADVEG